MYPPTFTLGSFTMSLLFTLFLDPQLSFWYSFLVSWMLLAEYPFWLRLGPFYNVVLLGFFHVNNSFPLCPGYQNQCCVWNIGGRSFPLFDLASLSWRLVAKSPLADFPLYGRSFLNKSKFFSKVKVSYSFPKVLKGHLKVMRFWCWLLITCLFPLNMTNSFLLMV